MKNDLRAMKRILYDMGLLTLVRWLLQRDFSTRKLDRGLCLSRTKICAGSDSRGFEPATPVAGPGITW